MQVMSLVMCPTLLDHPKVTELYPGDAIARAKQCLSYFSGGLGAYTDSRSAQLCLAHTSSTCPPPGY